MRGGYISEETLSFEWTDDNPPTIRLMKESRTKWDVLQFELDKFTMDNRPGEYLKVTAKDRDESERVRFRVSNWSIKRLVRMRCHFEPNDKEDPDGPGIVWIALYSMTRRKNKKRRENP